MSEDRRIVVELISHSEVQRLESRDDDVRREVAQLRGEVDGLRRLLYEVMETIGEIRRRK